MSPATPALPEIRTRIDLPFTVVNLVTTAAPLVLAFFYHTPSSIAAFFVCYTVFGLGLTVGYHRLFSHAAFRVPKWLEHAIAVCGYLAIQRGPLFWVAMHRLHHKHVDIPGKDPHTPKEGLWHVHFGWTHLRRSDVWDQTVYRKWVPDLVDDKLYRLMDHEATDYATYVLLNAGAFVAGGLLGQPGGFDTHNAVSFLVWVGMLSRVALLHAFGFINSVCHLLGSRPFKTKPDDRSTNNVLVSLLIFGEGWHNNHHAFPGSAHQGMRWYQVDPSWWVIRLLETLGLASNVRRVPPRIQERKRRKRRPEPRPFAAATARR
jgi:stearoyl-CoA desaturase (delta-9 desaturase)